MSASLLRLKLSDDLPKPDWADCYKVYTLCLTEKAESSTTIADIKELQTPDKRKAQIAYMGLLHRAHIGAPLHQLYDGDTYHPGHTYKRNKSTVTINRIRQGDIRIYLIHMPNKIVLILKTSAKHKNKLKLSETRELEQLADIALDHLDQQKPKPKLSKK